MRIKKTGWDGFSFRGIYYLKVLEQRPKETVFQVVNFESHFAMHSSFYVNLNEGISQPNGTECNAAIFLVFIFVVLKRQLILQ